MTIVPASVTVWNGEMVVIGGNWLTRRLLCRHTRREILWPRKLLLPEPVVYGPSREELELWHAVALFNEEMRVSAACQKRAIEGLRQSLEDVKQHAAKYRATKGRGNARRPARRP